jgi:replication factor A1
MKIKELKNGSRKVSIEAKITSLDDPREVNTRNGPTKVTNAVIEDDTGNIILVLWGDEIDKVREGDVVKIENGFVSEWNNELQLSAGKYGKLSVV